MARNNCWIKAKENCQIEAVEKPGKYRKNWIKELREARDWTLRDLSKLTGWHHQTISNLELLKAELTVDKVYKLAEIFGCHPLEITEGPEALVMPKNETQKKVLEALNRLSEKDQELYAAGFLSGLNMQPEGNGSEKDQSTLQKKK